MLATLAPSLKPSVRRAPANPAARIEPQSMRDTSGERGISEAALYTATRSRYPYRITVRANTHPRCILADSRTATSHHNGRHQPHPERTRRPPHPHPACQASLQSRCPWSRRIHVVLRMFFMRKRLQIGNKQLTRQIADVQSLPRRPGTPRPKAPLGPLNASVREGRKANRSLLRKSEKPCIYTAAAETRRWA